jgi:hypothetical protein
VNGGGWEIAVIVALPFAVAWFGRAIFRPMAPCRWCRGRRRAGSRRRWRNLDCSHCGNSGQRMTWGGRLFRGDQWGK